MPHPDAQVWNARYESDDNVFLRRQPYSLVRSFAGQLPKGGLALEVAAGMSPVGLFLASRGLRVIAMDISEAGLRIAQQRAHKRSLPLNLVVMDLTDPWLPRSGFDVILNFYFLSRPLFECYRQALKPGGWLFFETFSEDNLGRSNPDHTLNSGELYSAFQNWDILYWKETLKK
ncbi:MAG: class I SAM-dependent methyltransferase, partial [Anaerolineales bacterium]